ncbi:MAG: DUF3459 domain-containing protein [Pirellulales bacterium]|nr:DUF3459 domain-containing protein [Pirellulales bacterium]
MDDRLKQRLDRRLKPLYGDRAAWCLDQIAARLVHYLPKIPPLRKTAWDQRDVMLITYGDQVRGEAEPPLATLGRFLAMAGLQELLGTVHVLPFFPYSSDDGFSVIDYRTVDPALGGWADVQALGERFDLMFDLVVNHVSRRSRWFQDYAAGREPYTGYFIEMDPQTDLSTVTRPRSLPLLTPVETARGTRHLWTTFSDDQLDLNFAEPAVLVEMIDVLLFYLQQGARFIRLDAIAYLWKQPGTSCIHLPQTHAVVKLLRDLVDAVAPGAILLTETNVPHQENASYLGEGDEAQMIYQFSLAPLLLEALLSGDATLLGGWLAELPPAPPQTTVLNFTASHDGIGVRPLEGIMPTPRFDRLLKAVEARGGYISTKRNPDGSDSPYELNITYFDALAEPGDANPAIQVRRFLASQALMLSVRGIPAVYFHSLVGTPNNTAGVARTGRPRSINRRKFELAELQTVLGAADSPPAMVLDGYRRLLQVRVAQPAFHPDAAQVVVPLGHPSLVALVRKSIDGRQTILVVGNLGPQPQSVDVRKATGAVPEADLLGGHPVGDPVTLSPYQVAWITLKAPAA